MRLPTTVALIVSAAMLLTACGGGGGGGQTGGGAAKPTAAAPAKTGEPAAAPAASPAASPAAAASPGAVASPGAAASPAASPAAGPVASGTAQKTASGYPAKAIDLIVAFAPGGAADGTARLVAGYFQTRWGVPINVINLPGGSGTVGTLRGLQAAPDGYTMLLDNHASTSLLAASTKDLPFDWKKRSWVARTNNAPVFYAVKSDSPWRTLDDMVAAARDKPRDFTWGSAGTSAIGTWAIGQILTTRNIKVSDTNGVTFNSGGEVLTALAGGQIQIAAQQLSEVKPLVSTGRIRLLAAISDTRLPDFPDVPTAAEQGYRELNVIGWQGVNGPPGLPADVVKFWVDEMQLGARDPAFQRRGSDLGSVIDVISGAEFEKWVDDQYQAYLPLAQALGLR